MKSEIEIDKEKTELFLAKIKEEQKYRSLKKWTSLTILLLLLIIGLPKLWDLLRKIPLEERYNQMAVVIDSTHGKIRYTLESIAVVSASGNLTPQAQGLLDKAHDSIVALQTLIENLTYDFGKLKLSNTDAKSFEDALNKFQGRLDNIYGSTYSKKYVDRGLVTFANIKDGNIREQQDMIQEQGNKIKEQVAEINDLKNRPPRIDTVIRTITIVDMVEINKLREEIESLKKNRIDNHLDTLLRATTFKLSAPKCGTRIDRTYKIEKDLIKNKILVLSIKPDFGKNKNYSGKEQVEIDLTLKYNSNVIQTPKVLLTLGKAEIVTFNNVDIQEGEFSVEARYKGDLFAADTIIMKPKTAWEKFLGK